MHPVKRTTPTGCDSQRGAVLVISLIILLLLTIIGVTSMRGTILEERMAGNLRDRNLSFQAAETGLQGAYLWLTQQPSRPQPNGSGSNGVWTEGSAGQLEDIGFAWATNGTEYGTAGTQDISFLAADPRYIIEERNFVPDDLSPESRAKGLGRYYYDISSIGYGGSTAAQTVLQITIPRRYN